MIILKDSEWKYKLPFDNDLYKEIKRYSFTLGSKERAELDFEIDFYRSFFSFEQVLQTISKIHDKDKAERFKIAVEKRINCLLYCPHQLVSYYKNLIDKQCFEHSVFLNEILKMANKKGIIISPQQLYKNILGDKCFKIAKKQCLRYSKRQTQFYPKKRVEAGRAKEFSLQIIDEIKKDFTLQGLWGKYDINKFTIVENSDFGYGKWVDEKVSYLPNTFYMNSNMYMADQKDIEYSIYSNIYPGTANFYSQVLDLNKFSQFDNGANWLINGWSTFAFWHVKPCTFSRNSKYLNCKTVSFMFSKNFNQQIIDKLYTHLLSYNNRAESINHLITLTQYLGKFESSILGALAVENLIDSNKKGISAFIGFMQKNNVGNFFDFYLTKILARKK